MIERMGASDCFKKLNPNDIDIIKVPTFPLGEEELEDPYNFLSEKNLEVSRSEC